MNRRTVFDTKWKTWWLPHQEFSKRPTRFNLQTC